MGRRRVSFDGAGKRRGGERTKARTPEATQDQNMPRAEARDAFFVSSLYTRKPPKSVKLDDQGGERR